MNNNPLPTHCRDLLPKAVFKRDCADFQVDEQLGFEPDGEGAHLWFHISKTGCNTADVVSSLATSLGVAEKDVGYSGMKDKHAVTSQWISLPYPIHDPLPERVDGLPEGVEILTLQKSGKKLRRGAHRMNVFKITLREIETSTELVEKNIQKLVETGFPNYFGPQRFGIDGRNVHAARNMFGSRKRKLSRFKRSIYLSAARSHLFNLVLGARVSQENWLTILPGEVCMLDGSNSVFACEAPDAEIQKRHDQYDIHATGPLYGAGDGMTGSNIMAFESDCLRDEEILCQGLAAAGLNAERRSLRAISHNLQWNWLDARTLELSFTLNRGVYATSLLREIVNMENTA